MSLSHRLLVLTGTLLVGLCFVLPARAAFADPSGRVARLSDVRGDVSHSPAGEDEWLQVQRNRPLTSGDRLWTEQGARLELQLGSAAIRLDGETSFQILDLNDRIAQLEVSEGTIDVGVRRLYRGQSIEIATPTLAFVIQRAGRYRIDVDPYDNQTTIVVWQGAGIAYGDGANFPMRGGDSVRFYDTDLRDHQAYGLPRADDFDRYCVNRDRRLDRSESLNYLSDDVIGYSDLDEYGRWSRVGNYGNVWFPNDVGRDWAPYRDGHWAWQEPWGWTWVDNAPWGFAPSHYGRWVHVSNRWGWIPGPRNVRAIYAPALVAFVGGRNWSLSLSFGDRAPVGWFPLGPREAYVPSYRASRDYFTRVNVNNTVINNTTITNIYNNYASGNNVVTQSGYVNRAIAGAVTAVPSEVFMNARPVRQAAMNIDRRALSSGEISRLATIAPSQRSVFGAAKASDVRPSRAALERSVLARNTPPPREASFAERERDLKRNPGRPLESRPDAGHTKALQTSQQIRVISDQRAALNAREAGSTRRTSDGAKATTPTTALPALDRSAPADDERRGRVQSDRARGDANQAAGDKSAREKAAGDQAAARELKSVESARAESEHQSAVQKQQGEAQRAREQQQQQRERQRQDEAQAQKNEKQRARQVEQVEQQAERQRQADDTKRDAEIERQRGVELQQQQQREQQQKDALDLKQQQALEQQQARERRETQRLTASEQQAAAAVKRAAREREAAAQSPLPAAADSKTEADADAEADQKADAGDKPRKGKNKDKEKDKDKDKRNDPDKDAA